MLNVMLQSHLRYCIFFQHKFKYCYFKKQLCSTCGVGGCKAPIKTWTEQLEICKISTAGTEKQPAKYV